MLFDALCPLQPEIEKCIFSWLAPWTALALQDPAVDSTAAMYARAFPGKEIQLEAKAWPHPQNHCFLKLGSADHLPECRRKLIRSGKA